MQKINSRETFVNYNSLNVTKIPAFNEIVSSIQLFMQGNASIF